MLTLKFKAQPSIKCSAAPPSFRLLLSEGNNQIVVHSLHNETVLGSSRKLGGAAEHLIDGREKRICRSSFEFQAAFLWGDQDQ